MLLSGSSQTRVFSVGGKSWGRCTRLTSTINPNGWDSVLGNLLPYRWLRFKLLPFNLPRATWVLTLLFLQVSQLQLSAPRLVLLFDISSPKGAGKLRFTAHPWVADTQGLNRSHWMGKGPSQKGWGWEEPVKSSPRRAGPPRARHNHEWSRLGGRLKSISQPRTFPNPTT